MRSILILIREVARVVAIVSSVELGLNVVLCFFKLLVDGTRIYTLFGRGRSAEASVCRGLRHVLSTSLDQFTKMHCSVN